MQSVRPNIRPHELCHDTLPFEDAVIGKECEADEEQEEGRVIKSQKILYQPAHQEWDDHMRTHIPFRKWCPYCVGGKCVSGAHRRNQKTDEEIEQEIPVISVDYMGPKSKDDKSAKIDSLPILVGVDRKSKWIFAHMVPSKGLDPHAIKMMSREIRLAGYSTMVIKSDQEPSILALIEAVKREKGEAVEVTGKEMKKRKGELQIIAEESPVGEHQSNGEVENAIKSVQSQMRTMRLALQARYKSKIRTDHPIMPWLVHHAAILIDICRVGNDGRTPYERKKGKKFIRALPEIGECIWYLRPQSVGKDKLDTRWESGVFAGLRVESGELYVLTEGGALKVNSFNRRPEEERWNQEEFGAIQGTPWEPIPGREGIEVKSRFQYRGEAEEEIIPQPSTRDVIPRRIYIRREDVADSNMD